MTRLVSFVGVGFLATLLSSCFNGGADTPSPPVSVGVSFESHVQDADLDVASDRVGEQAKDEHDNKLSSHVDVVVTDESLPPLLVSGLGGFALPAGGCRVINNGVYVNYLVSHRHGKEGELGCESSCSNGGVVTATRAQQYKILLCVHADEHAYKYLVIKPTDCKSEQGFARNNDRGRCIHSTRATAKHCKDKGAFVLNKVRGGGCRLSDDCTQAGYKVESHTCLAKVAGDCTDTQGFAHDKCIAATTVKHCTDRGAYIFNKVGGGGCRVPDACENDGYKVVGHECVSRVASECTGVQGFEDGMCLDATTIKQCIDRGREFVLSRVDGGGCLTTDACEAGGYKVAFGETCISKAAADCTGTQGFENGLCIVATEVKHCTDRGSFILNKQRDGCQIESACEADGYKVVSNACSDQLAGDCTGTQGFETGKCIAATTVKQCTDRGAFILDSVGGGGCQTSTTCTANGYKVVSDACVFKVGGDCEATQGFEAGKCIAATTVKQCTDKGSQSILSKITTRSGCTTRRRCLYSGYKIEADTCFSKGVGDCTGEQGFSDGKCLVATTVKHCTDRGGEFVFNRVANRVVATGCLTADACETDGYKVVAEVCVRKVAGDCTGAEEGFANGKCVARPRHATHCQAVGKVLQFDRQGCATEQSCTDDGYKVVSNACVGQAAGDCTGTQGLAAGKCVAHPQDGLACRAVGKVLAFDRQECQPENVCTDAGRVVNDGACVVQEARACTDEQGFDGDTSMCVANPIDATYCQAVAKVLQFDRRGCEPATACIGDGHKVVDGVCSANVSTDCGEQGLLDGRCITPTAVMHCHMTDKLLHGRRSACVSATECVAEGFSVDGARCSASSASDCQSRSGLIHRGDKCVLPTTVAECGLLAQLPVLNKAGKGCQTEDACRQEGYKVESNTCVAKVAGDCTGTQGFEDGRCIDPTTVLHCLSRGIFYVINPNFDGCIGRGACTGAGHRLLGSACVGTQIASNCKGEQGFNDGTCVDQPTDPKACQRVDKVLQFDKEGCQTADQCANEGYKADTLQAACIAQGPTDCVDESIISGRVINIDEDKGLVDGTCTAMTTKPEHCQAISSTHLLQADREGCVAEAVCLAQGYKTDGGACTYQTVADCSAEQGFYGSRCTDNPTDLGRRLCLGLAGDKLRGNPRDCSMVEACAQEGNEQACMLVKAATARGGCGGSNTHIFAFDSVCANASDVCMTSQVIMNEMCVSNRHCPEGWGVDVASRTCVETPSPAQCVAIDGRVVNGVADTAQCITLAQCSRNGFKVTGTGEEQTCGKKVADDCPIRAFDAETGRCVTTALSTPEAIDTSFDEAFDGKETRPISFCIIGSGAVADSMVHISNTITDTKTCHHEDLDTPENLRQAFVDTESLLGEKKIVGGSIVAFDSATLQKAFGDNGLNVAQLEGYKLFMPTGDSGQDDFLVALNAGNTKARIHDALHGGNMFAVGRLNDAGDGRHAESNGCGDVDNCVLANGSFTVNGAAFDGTQGATAYVSASIARAMTYAHLDTPISAVNQLFDAAKVEVNGVSVFHPFRLIDKAGQLAREGQRPLVPYTLGKRFDTAFSADASDVMRPTDICFVDGGNPLSSSPEGVSHLNLVKETQKAILSAQQVPCERNFERANETDFFPEDYFGDNSAEGVKIPVGAIVTMSIQGGLALPLLLEPHNKIADRYKIFIAAGNFSNQDTPSAWGDAMFTPARQTHFPYAVRGEKSPGAIEHIIHHVFNSKDVFYVSWLDRDNPSRNHAMSSICGLLPQCAAALGGFYVRVPSDNGRIFYRFGGTSSSTAYVSASIARAMLNAPPDTPLDQVNDFFHGATEWLNGIKVFNPLKLIDLVAELWQRPRLTSDVADVAGAFDEAFDGTYAPSPRSVQACAVGNTTLTADVLMGMGGAHVDVCMRTVSDTDGVRAAFTSSDSNVRLPQGSIVALVRRGGFATGGLTAADLSGYKVFVPTGNGTSADFLTDSSLYDTDTVARMQDALQGGNLFYVARLNNTGTGLNVTSNGCGDVDNCVTARGLFTLNGTNFGGTQAAATYVAAAMARAMAHTPAGTPLDYVNDLFRKATVRHGENVTADKYDVGIRVFNPFRLIDAVRALRVRPLTVSEPHQIARAFDETFALREDVSPRDTTLCFMGKRRSTQLLRAMASQITDSLGEAHVALCRRHAADPAGVKTAVMDRDAMTSQPEGSLIVLSATDSFATGGLVRADLSGYKFFAPTGDAPEDSRGVADFLMDSIYDTDTVTRMQDALAGDNLFYVAALNEDGTGLHTRSNGCGSVENCVAARGSFTVNGKVLAGTPVATTYVAASIARAMAHLPSHLGADYVNTLFETAKMAHNGMFVFNPFRLIDDVRDISLRELSFLPRQPQSLSVQTLNDIMTSRFVTDADPVRVRRDAVDACFVGGTQASRAIAVAMLDERDNDSLCVTDSPRDLVDVRHSFGRDDDVDDALRQQMRFTALAEGRIVATQGIVGGKSIFRDGGIERADLEGYKVFVGTGDNGVADFLTDTSLYDTQAVVNIKEALKGDDLFFVARLDTYEWNEWHEGSNGCGDVDNCVGVGAPEVVDGETATAFLASFMARAMQHTPVGTSLDFVNSLFNAAIDVVKGIQVFNPLKAIDLVASLYATPTSPSVDTSVDASAGTGKYSHRESGDDIYQALMRAQYAAVGQAGVPTEMDAVRIDITEFGETRAFTMPALSYRYEFLPAPSHSTLFGMLGMVYRPDGRYPEVGLALNDKEGRTFISASHYRSEDFFGAYGSGAFDFEHVDNYRVVGKHEVVAGLDVTLWGRCGFVREAGLLLDWQRGCDSGADVSYAHGFMGGELTWRAGGARFLGGSMSSSGRRYRIRGGASEGEASVQLRFQW
ncbi:MAG: hypothetical protein GDA50_07725 [Alphaproteobacteria bacterium GM202ARS2]|nr:hypothetical protein [Alphaproteobacteria bacterium GM202ARS2]